MFPRVCASLLLPLLTVQCFNAENGNKFDEMSLYKPAGWRPCPEEAEKYYESLPLVDNPIGE